MKKGFGVTDAKSSVAFPSGPLIKFIMLRTIGRMLPESFSCDQNSDVYAPLRFEEREK